MNGFKYKLVFTGHIGNNILGYVYIVIYVLVIEWIKYYWCLYLFAQNIVDYQPITWSKEGIPDDIIGKLFFTLVPLIVTRESLVLWKLLILKN